jgi:hypothetical protein
MRNRYLNGLLSALNALPSGIGTSEEVFEYLRAHNFDFMSNNPRGSVALFLRNASTRGEIRLIDSARKIYGLKQK